MCEADTTSLCKRMDIIQYSTVWWRLPRHSWHRAMYGVHPVVLGLTHHGITTFICIYELDHFRFRKLNVAMLWCKATSSFIIKCTFLWYSLKLQLKRPIGAFYKLMFSHKILSLQTHWIKRQVFLFPILYDLAQRGHNVSCDLSICVKTLSVGYVLGNTWQWKRQQRSWLEYVKWQRDNAFIVITAEVNHIKNSKTIFYNSPRRRITGCLL